MALDPVVNFFESEIATLPVASGGTVIVLSSGDGNKLPNPSVDGAFNLTIYEEGNPFSSPEIVRVTARTSDTLTVTRAQEGTTATTKTTGTTWKVVMFPTAKTIQDIDDKKLDVAGGTMTGDLIVPNIGVNKTPTAGIRVDVSGVMRASTGILFGTDTASANTLGDYEQGTFTPEVSGSTTAGTGTYSNQIGRYTRTGNLVTAFIRLSWSAHDGTGNFYITGLPFTLLNLSNYLSSASIGLINDISLSANNIATAFARTNTTRIEIFQTPVGGGLSAIIPLDTAGAINLTVTYQV